MDIVVTVPKGEWKAWIHEGDLPGTPDSGTLYEYSTSGRATITPGERVYVVAYGKLRGYAPLVRIQENSGRRSTLLRGGGAVAVTIPQAIPGFRGWRYRWWTREIEVPFPDWQTA